MKNIDKYDVNCIELTEEDKQALECISASLEANTGIVERAKVLMDSLLKERQRLVIEKNKLQYKYKKGDLLRRYDGAEFVFLDWAPEDKCWAVAKSLWYASFEDKMPYFAQDILLDEVRLIDANWVKKEVAQLKGDRQCQ